MGNKIICTLNCNTKMKHLQVFQIQSKVKKIYQLFKFATKCKLKACSLTFKKERGGTWDYDKFFKLNLQTCAQIKKGG